MWGPMRVFMLPVSPVTNFVRYPATCQKQDQDAAAVCAGQAGVELAAHCLATWLDSHRCASLFLQRQELVNRGWPR